MPEKKSNVKVVIVKREGEFLVQPAVAVLEKDSSEGSNGRDHDRLKIYPTRPTRTRSLRIGKDRPIGSDLPFGNVAPQTALIRSRRSIQLQVVDTAVEGSYIYEVWMVASRKKAHGNSDPMLIIEN